jgi:hypothetical protein
MFDLFFGWAWCENRARNSGMRARDVVRTAEEENAKMLGCESGKCYIEPVEMCARK